MQSTHGINGKAVLMFSLELANKSWKVALSDGCHARPAQHKAEAPDALGRLQQVVQLLETTKAKWALGEECEMVGVCEAGQDGFWIERALLQRGVRLLVVDAASIPVARQARRAKTDRLDAIMLLEQLQGWLRGERSGMRVVHVPAAESEAQRQLPRDRGELQKEIGQHRDRMRKLLRTQGCWAELQGDVLERLRAGEFVCWDGKALPQQLYQRLERECERLRLVQRQLNELEKTLVQQLPEEVRGRIGQLAQLRGVGPVGAMRLVLELYWRDFSNRRQVGACVGLVSQPYDSGDSRVDQGISKQGNRRVRALLIEMAWMWRRYQPDSAIAQWFAQRTGTRPGAASDGTNKRGKRIAIVAVARRLAIALWRYLKDGVIPAGAQLKGAQG